METGNSQAIAPPNPTSAAEVLQAATNINALSQLFMFIKASQLGRAAETGTMMQVELYDAHRTKIFLNSKLILPLLLEQFQQLGDSLESANIEIGELIQGLETSFNQRYGTGSPT